MVGLAICNIFPDRGFLYDFHFEKNSPKT
jgi:hypothetical protein